MHKYRRTQRFRSFSGPDTLASELPFLKIDILLEFLARLNKHSCSTDHRSYLCQHSLAGRPSCEHVLGMNISVYRSPKYLVSGVKSYVVPSGKVWSQFITNAS